jgi:hypothetical protein
MLFKKTPPPATEPIRQLEWKKVDCLSQTLCIAVEDWQYKVFPSRLARSFGTWMFQFEGRCGAGPLMGLTATGEVEVLERGEDPRELSDRWDVVPENIEGYAHLMDHDDRSLQPLFGVTLYCQESALDWIYRAFASAAFGRAGGLLIQLHLKCPNHMGGPFWRDQWRKEWLQVASWELLAGAQLRPPQ